jgi:Rap1a immunity proteins
MKRQIVYCAMWLVLAGLPLAAQTKIPDDVPFSTLRKLVVLCDNKHPTSRAACSSYIIGFVQGWDETLAKWVADLAAYAVENGGVAPSGKAIGKFANNVADEKARTLGVCIEKTWTAGYVSAVVVQYGLEHPGQLDRPLKTQMFNILAKAFPCATPSTKRTPLTER